MNFRLWLIKTCIQSLWNQYYPVNSLRMGFDDMLEVFKLDKIKYFPLKGFNTQTRASGKLRKNT
jgi:hypothetical protein